MKRLIFLISVLLVAFFATAAAYTPQRVVENDVGQYVVTPQTTDAVCVAQTSFILLERGVSVPYKGLTCSPALTFTDEPDFKCNTYYTIRQTDYKPHILAGYPNEINKYPFATDLGNW